MAVQSRVLDLVGAHCDLEQRLSSVPPSAGVRGMYMRAIPSLLQRAGHGEAARRLLGDASYSALRFYPVGDYLTHLAGGGALLASPGEVHAGMFELSRLNGVTFSESLLGRTLLRVLSREPRRLLRQATAAHRQSANYGHWELTFPGPTEARIEFVDEYVWIESALLGAAQGTFDIAGVSVQMHCELSDPFNGVHHLSW